MDIPEPHVTIVYCPRCRWLLRAAWYAQELLTTFEAELGAVTLAPSPDGGVFRIHLGETVVWDRSVDGGFPQPKVIKQRVRDRIAPERGLGHVDRADEPAR